MLLQLVLLSPRLVPPPLLSCWVNTLGTGPCPPLPGLGGTAAGGLQPAGRSCPSLPCRAFPPARDGDVGTVAVLQAVPEAALLPLAALCGCHDCEGGTHTPELCPGARRAQSPWAGWRVTPSQLLAPRWWGWGPRAGPEEPPPHSFCLRVCLSGRAGAACALSANAAPCFLMLMLL